MVWSEVESISERWGVQGKEERGATSGGKGGEASLKVSSTKKPGLRIRGKKVNQGEVQASRCGKI